ncbi:MULTISPECIES: hypothetical protein [Flavobacterium]|uniref:Lipoprotein n=1 Tax=Flavobacterium endoglycinae TaxID=2816357 RepID=A0ABX7QHU3_9FLAO|nr:MULTISPECIES: hypothetical protein [Flavobacterium]QSW89951.1 hypothetical protein J0383_03825 [Flavobacterium endoglycinae]
MKKSTNKYYGKSLLFAFAFSALFLFQNCSDETSDSASIENALKKESVSKDGKTSKTALTNTIISSQVTASGPTYIQGGTTLFEWQYTGSIPNPDLNSIIWWYSKVNNNGEAPYAIGWGATGYFMSVPDTYYSDPGLQTSNFKIYLTIRDTSGNLYQSYSIYQIMKKGKYKLENSL